MKKVERIATLKGSIRRKLQLAKRYAMPGLAVHNLSKCFRTASMETCQDSLDELIPRLYHSSGLTGFNQWKHGFNLPSVRRTCAGYGARMISYRTWEEASRLLWALDHDTHVVDTGSFARERAECARVLAPVVRAMIQTRGHVTLASDGSFKEDHWRGSIGLVVGDTAFGFSIDGKVVSSTHAENLGLAALARCARQAALVAEETRVWCDSQNAIRNQTSSNPLASPPCTFFPAVSWARGHATNVHINRADTAAKNPTDGCLPIAGLYPSNRLILRRTVGNEDHVLQYCESASFARWDFEASHMIARRVSEMIPIHCWRSILRSVKNGFERDMWCHVAKRDMFSGINTDVTDRPCPVPGCKSSLTPHHVFLASNPPHVNLCGTRANAHPGDICKDGKLQTLFAYGDVGTLTDYVARRCVGFLTGDDKCKRLVRICLQVLDADK